MKTWILLLILAACLVPGLQAAIASVDLQRPILVNPTPYIPAQCYATTRIGGREKMVRNPCYVCHTRSPEPNYVNDQVLQTSYSLPAPALENPWTNLFEDRRDRIQAISDTEIETYIRQDNFLDDHGGIILADRLRTLPASWDYNGNGHWDGYTPDCRFYFDVQGFDRTPDGGYTGWRAFAYLPFPGLFWPVNGSADDVMIRLASPFRRNERGDFDPTVYQLNLAIVEALIRRCNVPIAPVDEQKYKVDLDRNGSLGRAVRVVYDWAPLKNRTMSFVGQARLEQTRGHIHLAAGLFPEGTEFLSSLRYLDTDSRGRTIPSRRLKELRYMKKNTWMTYSALEEATLNEVKERSDFPDRTRLPMGDPERGISNGTGWIMQGFIEAHDGSLRPQNFEETASCIGCHGGIGATTDSVFAFPRKLDSDHFRRGWFHWSSHGLAGLSEPKIRIRGGGVYYEYSYYLMYSHGIDDFMANREAADKFFDSDGTVEPLMLEQIHDDINCLLYPSATRARQLNKSYRTIVQDQDFIRGRESLTAPATGILARVKQNQTTGIVHPTSIDSFLERFAAARETGAGKAAVVPERTAQEQKNIHRLTAPGLAGPDGKVYEVDRYGIIHRSSYAVPGVYFPFPRRLTMPTRTIVPAADDPICARCHQTNNADLPGMVSLPSPATANDRNRSLPTGMYDLTRNPGMDFGGKWSPDGKAVVFVSNRSGNSQLWLTGTTRPHVYQLTSGARIAAWPQWSQDGHSIVFWSRDPMSGDYEIESVQVDGKTTNLSRRTLVRSREPLARPTFHPDGRQVAYAAMTDSNWDIWLVDVTTGQSRRLTRDQAMETNPRWRPDGLVLAYKVAPTGRYPLTEEYFMTFEQGLEKPTIHHWDGPQSMQMNDWSPDGGKITYTAEIISNSTGHDRVTYAAMVSDLVLEGDRAVTRNTKILSCGGTLGDRGPVFSPDGQRIAFWAWDTDAAATLWLYNLEDDRLSRLTRHGPDSYPRWSPDGNQLLFTSTRTGNSDLMLLSLSGK